jgi:hypothetical protein
VDHAVIVRVMCSMLVLGLNVSSRIQSSGTRVCFFSNFLLFRIKCVKYIIAILGKDSISSWILELDYCKS